jgi:hypothetical protein
MNALDQIADEPSRHRWVARENAVAQLAAYRA